METQITESKFRAVVIDKASKLFHKTNGATFVLHAVEALDGIFKGMPLTGTRTMLNADQQVKDGVVEGQEVTIHMTTVQNPNGTKKRFFEIGTGVVTATDAEIEAKIEAAMAAAQAI